jgi:hypothetical protein
LTLLVEIANIVLVVEAASRLLLVDARDRIERMGILRAYAGEYEDQRSWLGAIGGAALTIDVRKAALKAVLPHRTSRGTMMISAPEGFKPKEWTFYMTPQTRLAVKHTEQTYAFMVGLA